MMASRQLLRLAPRRSAHRPLSRSLTTSGRLQSNGNGSGAGPAASKGYSAPAVLGVALFFGAVGWNLSSRRHTASQTQQLLTQKEVARVPRERFASLSELEAAIAEINKEIDDEDLISTDAEDLEKHGYSEWSTVNPDRLPVAVAYPKSTQEVSTIARICHKYHVPIVPYSGGSSLEGNFSAPYGGISIDFAHMDQILQFNKEDMDVVVQPSIGWQDLNAKLVELESGLFFPVDPGPTAKIGGMVGTNCSGTNAVKYGTMKDWVINLTVVLSDGRIIKTRRRPRKSSAGYNLNSLFVGSEGTLGIVTEATLKLAVIPEEYSVAVVTFPTIRDAASAAAGVMQAAVPVNCMEIMDEVQMKVVNLSGNTAPRTWQETPTLFFKFAGTKAGVAENIEQVKQIAARNKSGSFEFAADAEEQKLLWSARKESLWSMLALRKEGQDVWSTDVAVPFSRLADIIEISKKEMDELGLFASILGHVGDGNFHESIMYDRKSKKERDMVEKVVKNMVRRAIEMEGTCTGEHSIGWGKKESLLLELGPETIDIMRTIKRSLDPSWILNPGKIMDVPWLEGEKPKNREDVVTTPGRPDANEFDTLSGPPQPRLIARMASHLQRESSSSASSSASSTDYCSTPPTDVSNHPPPHRLAPRALKLSKLPDGTTVKDLHRWFSPHGNLVSIEVYPQKNKDGLLGGCVAFHDPIYCPFWDRDALHVQPPDSTVYPHGVNIGISPIQNDINSRDSQKLDVSVVSFSATCLEFGSFKTDNELVIDGAVHASSSEALTLELLPFSKDLVAHFSFPVNVRMGSRFRHYKFTAPLAFLKVQYETDKNGDPAFLVISLPHPPTYSWRCDDTIWDMPQSARRWSPWKRATDICEDRNLPGQLPLRTYSEYHNISGIDIGRLTTFRFTLHDDADSNVEQLIDMLGILEDFNVTPVQCDIKTSCATTNMWNKLDYNQESANGISSLSLANLTLTEDKVRLEFHVRYLLEVCISRNYLNEYAVGGEFLAKLAQTDPTIAARLLEYVIDKGLRLPKPLELFEIDSSSPALHKKEMPHYCALVYKVHVTPTGLRPNPPNVELSNRVMRKYKHIADRFLRVQFLEETEMRHMAKTKDNKDEIWKRIERTFNRGIQIGDRLYEFLGFGSSQLKEGGVLFFCPTSHESCNDVRAWMGNFEHIKSIAKYGARLGQCLSTTREIRGMPAPTVRYIDDIERNGDCFTDGVGIISKFMSRLIIQDMAIDMIHEPSAIQFRMGGCKGVLTVWPQAKRTEVYIRQSQEKFRSSFNNLEVIRCSRYSTATLNRQTIAILECLGVPQWAFMSLLTEQINQYEAVLSCNDLAIHMLTKFVDENQSTLLLAELIHAGFKSESTLEPFVVNMLMLWRSWSLKLLKEKARIHVEKSAFVLGCVDETGTLRGHDKSTEGQTTKIRDKLPQIFLQYNDPRRSNKTIILRGICIVGRNPSLHPGDIRVVEAVDNPALHHLKDVVVFPSTGDRSVPGMLSGGDLDGDDYFVIWDDRLLPKEWNYPPMDYSAPTVRELERPVTLDDIKQFAIQYMKNDVLGLVAIAHLCWSDSEPDGPKSELCRELAALHSMAVDYQKTGIPAILEDHMQPRRWPHYMDKRNSYKSKKALGKIYDKVMRSNISFSPDCSISFDKRILQKYTDLSQEVLDTARQIKSMYDLAMKRLMAQRHIETEYELFSGWALSSPAVGTDYKRQEDLGQDMEALKSRFRDKCCEVVAGRDDEAMNRFVAAMYTVTAEQAMKAQNGDGSDDLDLGYDGPPLISFPWIFDWVMVRLAMDSEYRPIRSTVRAARDKLFARGQTK